MNMKKIKKLVSILLIGVLFANIIAPGAPIQANSSEPIVVCVDGVEYVVELTEDLEIEVNANTDDGYANMLLEPDGTADVVIDNGAYGTEDYQLEITDLSTTDVDVDVYQENDLVCDYKEYENLVDDEYVGQAATYIEVQFLLTLGAILVALIATAAIMYIGQTLYIMAKEFYRTIQVASVNKQQKAKKGYYRAYITNNTVFICPVALSENIAAKVLAAGGDIYSFTQQTAIRVIYTSGYKAYSENGGRTPEIHTNGKHLKGKFVFQHYHRGITTSNGSFKKYGSTHSLFGVPVLCH